ncbi:Flap endonuclease 1 [Tolypocladium ophioglossoides CBS 100239]|uniref:Flap endonuclease 1 n=1 Tax=Tolypocladium ophioglossoides (strain CBS 100239) TaxID=1163406 RepID=A0A0L0N5J6_TOLOC|nr:Flap endonuclease 1 [Tolypocladium ophioglossoides CBS 100239]
MSSATTSRIRRTAQNTQFTYSLSRRINDVQTYPVQSPQGATIIVYGHENGVSLVWRGGRRFKPLKKQASPKEKQNGTSEDAVMIIDSDDDEPPAKSQSTRKFEDKPQFEDVAEQTPFPAIIQTLDLTLGTAVLNVAVMPMYPCTAQAAAAGDAPILAEKMVFAVSCVTSDVYVITLPLTPPSPESKARLELRTDLLAGKAGSGAWGESLVLLGGQLKHSDGLAMNLIRPKSAEQQAKPARAVVAACSRQASGTLLLWDVSLDPKAKPGRSVEPFQTEYLPNPLTSISFNPTHTTQLLAVSPHQAVRIYDFAISSLPPDPFAVGPFPSQGSWLLSLYQPFVRPSASRKPILDAAWISHGRAVFALMADGMWGIWDVDGVSPTSSGAAISHRLKSGVRGAALTAFSVSGYVEGTGSLRSVATQQKENQTGEFAPMTPHTRRQAAASLSTATTLDRLSTVHGGVRTVVLPPIGKSLQDESLVLWVGGQDHVCVVPAVSNFWDSQLRKGAGGGVNLFSGAQPTRMVRLLDLSTGLLGERCCGASLVVGPPQSGGQVDQDGGLAVDVLIQGESRIVVVRQGEGGPGKKIGVTVDSRRRRLFSKGERSDAIIVHGKHGRTGSLSYNLSTAKRGTLRLKSFPNSQDTTGAMKGADDTPQLPLRPRVGFEFMNTLNAAADASADLSRDVEAEMLDIMEIDHALKSMEGSRGSGRKKVGPLKDPAPGARQGRASCLFGASRTGGRLHPTGSFQVWTNVNRQAAVQHHEALRRPLNIEDAPSPKHFQPADCENPCAGGEEAEAAAAKMGIKQLFQIIKEEAPEAVKEGEIKNHFGRKVAIANEDASMSIYSFLIAVRSDGQQLMNDSGETTSNLMGMFYRTLRMVDNGIKPLYVFDGAPPKLKSGELAKRFQRKQEATEGLEEAKETGTAEDVEKFSRRTVRVTREHNAECQRLLKLMGIPYIVAPTEAEAQCAVLARAGKVYAAASEDMDTLCFNTPILLRHLTFSEQRKEPIQEIRLDKVLEGLNMQRKQFVDLCILLGCDYLDPIPKIGPTTALKLIREHGSLEKVVEAIEKDSKKKFTLPDDWPYKDARDLFFEPDVRKADDPLCDFKLDKPDMDGLVTFLVTEKGFSEDRVRSGGARLEKNLKSSQQARLEGFFKPVPKTDEEKAAHKRKLEEKNEEKKKKQKLEKKEKAAAKAKPRAGGA